MTTKIFTAIPNSDILVSNHNFSGKPNHEVANLAHGRYFAFEAPKKTPTDFTEVNLADVGAKMRAVRDFVDNAFVGKSDYIDCMVNAYAAMEHMVAFGKPGTAKTTLSELFMSGFTGTEFSLPLDPTTKPNMVFGPVNPKLYADTGRWERDSGGLFLGAQKVFFDEIGKAPDSILAALLSGLASRYVVNGQNKLYIPLHTCLTGTNENLANSDVQGLYSRFGLRFVSESLTEIDDMRAAICSQAETAVIDPAIVADLDQVGLISASAQYQAKNCDQFHPDFLDSYLVVWKTLIDKGFDIDNRVAIRAIKNVIADSIWRDETLSQKHISVVRHMFWNDPENDRAPLTAEVLALTDKDAQLMQEFRAYLQTANNNFSSLETMEGDFTAINGAAQDLQLNVVRSQQTIQTQLANLTDSANVTEAQKMIARFDQILQESPKITVAKLSEQQAVA